MSQDAHVTDHYTSGQLLERLNAALRDDGADPAHPTIEALAPYDQFHGRGLDSTEQLAAGLQVRGDDHLLDVGSGIGGPARYMSRRFGCNSPIVSANSLTIGQLHSSQNSQSTTTKTNI